MVRSLVKQYCKGVKVKLVFSSVKTKNLMKLKIMCPGRSAQMLHMRLHVRNVIPCTLVKRADTCQQEYVSIW